MTSVTSPLIILVDDDSDDLFLLGQVILAQYPSCQLITCSNGQEFIHFMERSPILPDLVLLDINMPIMDGFEALALLRQKSRYESTPVVMFTTSNQVSDRQQAAELKAVDFITKPTTLEQYNQIVLRLAQQWISRVS
jgi:CheY-like chemotaxis protein